MRGFTRALAVALGLLCVANAAARAGSAPDASREALSPPALLLQDVIARIGARYVDAIDGAALARAAIDGMVESLDPHSEFLDTDDFLAIQFRMRGKFGGIGVRVVQDHGLLRIKAPIEGSPAMRAGIQPNDVLTHINGRPVLGRTRREISRWIRGPIGTDLTVTLRRGSQPLELTLTRARVSVPPVRHKLEGDVGYVRITSFNRQTRPGLRAAMEAIERGLGPDLIGYVLDLRGNGGGRLRDAIWVADSFLEEGEIVSTQGREPEQDRVFRAAPGDLAHGRPIVVLINDRSASGSEIVAGALQDHGRALLLGTRSFGKGSIQTVTPLPWATALKLTTSRYLTPSGRSIQARGIEPDVEVGREAEQLPRALELLRAIAALDASGASIVAETVD